jgi:hypothetical protein
MAYEELLSVTGCNSKSPFMSIIMFINAPNL